MPQGYAHAGPGRKPRVMRSLKEVGAAAGGTRRLLMPSREALSTPSSPNGILFEPMEEDVTLRYRIEKFGLSPAH